MPNLNSNGITLEYDCFGDREAPPLLLVMGLGAQMILWDERFCEGLAARGHFVVRYDNRDIGLSTKFDAAGIPNVVSLMGEIAKGRTIDVPYTLVDMAEDAKGVLDALDFESAHVVGASMGGMIAQMLALRHPERVRTLTSIMSTTGRQDLPPATPAAMEVLLSPSPEDRDDYIEHSVRLNRVIGSSGFPFDEPRLRERAARQYDRSFYPQGAARQLAAVLAAPSRREALESLDVPTLVIHGGADPLVPLAGGLDTAEAIPGAELLVIEGMGHDLPVPAWPRIQDAITKLTHRD